MDSTRIAFDVDGCLRDAIADQTIAPIANENVRAMLITLSMFANVEIIVWSGVGELYARQIVAAFGLQSYVDTVADKSKALVLNVDVAFDDQEDCALGKINIIVNE